MSPGEPSLLVGTERSRSIGVLLLLAVACADGGDRRPIAEPAVPQPVAAPAPQRPAEDAASRIDAGSRRGSPGSDPAQPAPRLETPQDMLGVNGGTFVMGTDVRGEPDEQPAHRVTVGPFLLDRTEVTNRAYRECVDAGACRERKQPCVKGERLAPEKQFLAGQLPVSCVSHDDAETYCAWRGRRLPTEAEWERAASGSDGRRYPWGSEQPDERRAVFRGRVTAPVGSRPDGAGPYGHLDLAGNVWEWIADRYDPLAYRRQTASQGIPADCPEILRTQERLRSDGEQGFTGSNPIPTECEFVLRGGAFNYSGPGLRVTNRVHHPGDWRIIMAGFRCAADWPGGPVD